MPPTAPAGNERNTTNIKVTRDSGVMCLRAQGDLTHLPIFEQNKQTVSQQNRYQAEKTSKPSEDMPLGRKTRASSAGAQLETHYRLSILTEFGADNSVDGLNLKQASELPVWLKRELFRQEPRRHSFALGDDAKLNMRQRFRGLPASSLHKPQIDQMLSFHDLKCIRCSFDEFANSGIYMLAYDEFESVLKKCPGLETISDTQIKQLFMKIDYTGNGKIDWHAFCSYIFQESKEREETVRRSKMAAFILPATVKFLNCWEPVLRIHFPSNGSVMTLKEDGPERSITRRPKCATDFVAIPEYNKLIVGTGSREIQFYELSSLEPCCQLSDLETVALNLDCCSTGSDECVIVYGDCQGTVNILLMKSVREKLRLWKKLPEVEGIANISIDQAVESPEVTIIRWKVHQDWVSKVKYVQSLNAVVSASLCEESALVIGSINPFSYTHQGGMEEVWGGEKPLKVAHGAAGAQKTFNIPKGVSTFDLCTNINLLVTGGMDKLVRMWNPDLPGNATEVLIGHTAPVSYVSIVPEDGHIYSVSTDNIAMIWHIQDMTCLFTAHPNSSQIHGEISACFYSSAVKGLYIASDCFALLSLQIKQQAKGIKIVSHKEPVSCCGYSECFQQVVSCSEGSVVKVWDLETGALSFELGCAHGDSAITSMAFDASGRRLMTGGRDGLVKIWNFNNGQCVKILCKERNCAEICDCSYLTLHRNAFVISVGWGRSVDIYLDSSEETQYIQHPKPAWPDDVLTNRCYSPPEIDFETLCRNGHKEDIQCIAHCTPHLLATGSYSGEIIVWNVVSGRIQCRFQTPHCSRSQDRNTSVLSLIFLKSRAFVPEMSSSAWLASSGAQGLVHFWSVLNGGRFITSFQASHLQQQVTKLTLTQDDSLLFTADLVGFISVYDVKQYALGPEQTPPAKLNFWRAHIRSITSLKIIEKDQYLLTSSLDCSVRLWSIHGECIGTFGQEEIWHIDKPSSWKHPAVPDEVLIDPLSMPSHPVLENSLDSSEEIDNINKQVTVPDVEGDPTAIKDYNNFEDEILNLYESSKRQHHASSKRWQDTPSRKGSKVYDSLKDFELTIMPLTFKRPDLNSRRMRGAEGSSK